MFELKPDGFVAIAPLFDDLSLRHGSVRAVLRDPPRASSALVRIGKSGDALQEKSAIKQKG